MKIIKEGRKQDGWAMEVICTGNGNGLGGCGAKLLVEENDIFETENSDGEYFVTFECVCCGVITDIPNVYSELSFDIPSYADWMEQHEHEKKSKNEIQLECDTEKEMTMDEIGFDL